MENAIPEGAQLITPQYAMTYPDFAVAFRSFLRYPEEACGENTMCALRNLQKLVGKHIHFQEVPSFDPQVCDPDDVHPYIWYQIIGTHSETTLNCSNFYPDMLTLSVEIYSCDPAETDLISRYATQALDGYEGPFGGIEIGDAIIQSQMTSFEPTGINTPFIPWFIKTWNVDIYPRWCNCS